MILCRLNGGKNKSKMLLKESGTLIARNVIPTKHALNVRKNEMKYHLYNETFDYYHEPPVNKIEAAIFLALHKTTLDGIWVLHNEGQYKQWKQNQPNKFMDIGVVYNPYIPKLK